jgi:hypothetical protein
LIARLGRYFLPDQRYVRHVNAAYRRTATLKGGRYRAAPIDSDAPDDVTDLGHAEFLDIHVRNCHGGIEHERAVRRAVLHQELPSLGQ